MKTRSSKTIVILEQLKNQYALLPLLAWPKSDLINALNSGRNVDHLLANQMVSVVTSGRCSIYKNCYKPIEQYKRFIKDKFLVFGVSHNSNFDFLDLKKLIIKNNWYFIVGGDFWKNKVNDNIKSLLELYGIIATGEQTTGYAFDEENICNMWISIIKNISPFFSCIPPARLWSFFIFCTHHNFNDNSIHQFCLFPLYLYFLVVNLSLNLNCICFTFWKAWKIYWMNQIIPQFILIFYNISYTLQIFP